MHHYTYRRRRRQSCWPNPGFEFAFAGCGPLDRSDFERFAMSGYRRADEALFGARAGGRRRLLRYLADRLDLSRDQVADTARILERLKIERAQADVDLRRTSADLADALEGEAFDRARAEEAAERRVRAAKAVQEAVARALAELHEVLEEDQRRKLATLIRTGTVSF